MLARRNQCNHDQMIMSKEQITLPSLPSERFSSHLNQLRHLHEAPFRLDGGQGGRLLPLLHQRSWLVPRE